MVLDTVVVQTSLPDGVACVENGNGKETEVVATRRYSSGGLPEKRGTLKDKQWRQVIWRFVAVLFFIIFGVVFAVEVTVCSSESSEIGLL